MENQPQTRKLNKRDFVVLGVVLVLVIASFCWYLFGYQQKGSQIEITVDGQVYGLFDLNQNNEIPITTNNGLSNKLVLMDGYAKMQWANCPDKRCVHQKKISMAGETIVCLPNQVVVTVKGDTKQKMDTMAK